MKAGKYPVRDNQRLFWVWSAMRQRCQNQNDKGFKNYGARGIVVCDRWDGSFAAFVDDMGPRPAGALLDRTDNDGPYSPDNCKWSTRKEQNSNRRICIYVDTDGERITLKEASRRAGLRYRQVHKRITMYGWTAAQALSTPIERQGRHATRIG